MIIKIISWYLSAYGVVNDLYSKNEFILEQSFLFRTMVNKNAQHLIIVNVMFTNDKCVSLK